MTTQPQPQITSPTHGLAMGAELFISIVGVATLAARTTTKGIDTLIGPFGAFMWALGIAASPIVAMVASLSLAALPRIRRARRGDHAVLPAPGNSQVTRALRVEFVGMIGILTTFGFYDFSLVWFYGNKTAIFTFLIVAALAAGALLRCIQIFIELRRLKRSRDLATTAR